MGRWHENHPSFLLSSPSGRGLVGIRRTNVGQRRSGHDSFPMQEDPCKEALVQVSVGKRVINRAGCVIRGPLSAWSLSQETSMLSEEGTAHLFKQVHQLWIEPELSRRKHLGTLSPNFKIFRCLVRLPLDRPPLVQFNDEIAWEVKIKTAPGCTITKGQTVYLHNISEIVAV